MSKAPPYSGCEICRVSTGCPHEADISPFLKSLFQGRKEMVQFRLPYLRLMREGRDQFPTNPERDLEHYI